MMIKFKQIIPVIICLLIINIVTALDELEITLIAYNSETQSAQIQIKNIGSEEYHDLTTAIDNLQPRPVVGLLRPESAIKIEKGIPSGKHTITISTAEGVTVSKEIDFPKSQEQIKEELEVKRKAEELESGKIGEETKLRVYEKKEKPIGTIVIITVILALFLLLMYFIFKKK